MDYVEKIKALQRRTGIAEDGIASAKTWLNIYYLLFGTLPYDLNMDSLIKVIQQRLNICDDRYPWDKTWDVLYDMFITKDSACQIDPDNEQVLKNMIEEVVPFAKELVHLAAREGIYLRLVNYPQNDKTQNQSYQKNQNDHVSTTSFGLKFEVRISEKSTSGDPICEDNWLLYAKVAQLAQSIGLTLGGKHKTYTAVPQFELRPAWASRMKDNEMLRELTRRKKANINLLSIL